MRSEMSVGWRIRLADGTVVAPGGEGRVGLRVRAEAVERADGSVACGPLSVEGPRAGEVAEERWPCVAVPCEPGARALYSEVFGAQGTLRPVDPSGRAFLEALLAENPGLNLSSEDAGEAYLGLFDSLICCFPSRERIGFGVPPAADCVPAFNAVYHDAVATFGSYAKIDGIPPWDPLWPDARRWPPEAERDWPALFPDAFAVEVARGVAWGMQPTAHHLRPGAADDPRLADDYAFLVRTARFHRGARAPRLRAPRPGPRRPRRPPAALLAPRPRLARDPAGFHEPAPRRQRAGVAPSVRANAAAK